MLAPLTGYDRRKTAATIKTVPPPTDGWNAQDALEDMGKRDAVRLDNCLSTNKGVILRKGKRQHFTGMTDPVLSLMEYNPPEGAPKLFAATEDSIYDASIAGEADTPDVSSLTSGWWQHTMFATTGGSFLVACNGADPVQNYDGSSWSEPTITGVSSSDLINVCVHQARLWFIEKDSMNVWYLAALAISGAATKINLAALAPRGGKLVAMISWTRDGGSGMDDVACFFTSKGEVIMYSGTDPDSAETWFRVGSFTIPEPIGYRSAVKVGGDVGILTRAGLLPMSAVLSIAASGQARAAATRRIDQAFLNAAAEGGADLMGWQIIEHPSEKLLIVNVPLVETTDQVQFVAYEGKWARFTGFAANCWGLKGSDLFFGDNSGNVWQYTGTDDDGEAINALIIQAFQDFGSENSKTFTRIRPQFFGPSNYRPRVGLRIDYDDSVIDFPAESVLPSEGTAWDEGEWDVAEWAPGARTNAWWQSTVGEGYVAAVMVSISSLEPITYNGCKIAYIEGDGL